MVVVGRLVGTFEPDRVMVKIAHPKSASARAKTIAPSQAARNAAGKNRRGMSQSSASPASTASAHAIGGRTMTFAVSAVSAMVGVHRMGADDIIAPRRTRIAHLHRPRTFEMPLTPPLSR
jgi:hypothetical protein